MKRAALWMVTAGLIGFVAVVSCQAKERKPKAEPAAVQPAVEPAPQPPPVFTFTTDEEMQEFATIWQQRQIALTRIAVLQSYFSQEQEGVKRITEELSAKYHLDAAKSYSLDVPRKALVEVERKEPAAAEPAASEPATPQP